MEICGSRVEKNQHFKKHAKGHNHAWGERFDHKGLTARVIVTVRTEPALRLFNCMWVSMTKKLLLFNFTFREHE